MQEIKRLFFGLDVSAPWPIQLPHGRVLNEEDRHLTLAFLGNIPVSKIMEILPSIPLPLHRIGLTGFFDQCLFLPNRHPHVVAWHIQWLEKGNWLSQYQQQLIDWLKRNDFSVSEKNTFLPHVSLCREPFPIGCWKESFSPLPLFTRNLHLFESLGHSHYRSCWRLPFKLPFEEKEHTADIAFIILGQDFSQLYLHACLALAFKFPLLLDYFSSESILSNLDDVVIELNNVLTRADIAVGCPFKAISFHGSIQKDKEGDLKWEMIVDV